MSNRRETTEQRIRRMGRNAAAKMQLANVTKDPVLYRKGWAQQQRSDKRMIALRERKTAALEKDLLRQQPDADTKFKEGTTV